MKRNGFTLIEVLIALLIIAIALSGAIRATTQAVEATTAVKNKMAAHLVAMNILSGLQVGTMSVPKVGHQLSGRTQMMRRSWSWVILSGASSVPWHASQVRVTVSLRGHRLSTVTGFL